MAENPNGDAPALHKFATAVLAFDTTNKAQARFLKSNIKFQTE